jgi:hypothetical protein
MVHTHVGVQLVDESVDTLSVRVVANAKVKRHGVVKELVVACRQILFVLGLRRVKGKMGAEPATNTYTGKNCT